MGTFLFTGDNMKLNELIENKDNPSFADEEELSKLEGKLKRVPTGLKANRIAYVTDIVAGKKVVLSGNKRLRLLKKQYGEDAELPDDYFQDITEMSEAERHEFIVTANISDGRWDVDKLLAQYDISELSHLMEAEELEQLVGSTSNLDLDDIEEVDGPQVEEESASEVGKTYLLGANALECSDPVQCDLARKLFAEEMSGKGADWKAVCPEKLQGEE